MKQNTYFDIVWVKEMGYVYLGGISPDREHFDLSPTVIHSGKEICAEIIRNIAEDVLAETGKCYESFSECSDLERENIENALSSYMKQLPEYAALLQDLFMK